MKLMKNGNLLYSIDTNYNLGTHFEHIVIVFKSL